MVHLEETNRQILLIATWVANHLGCLEVVQATRLCVGAVHLLL